MSITDELRRLIEDPLLGYASQDPHIATLTKIADSIDVEHERACKEQYACGAEHGIGASIEASMIQEYGFIELPKDADGMPIRVGDVLEGETIGGGFGEPFEVIGYIMSNGELEPMDKHKCPRMHKYSHHYHEQTVEDVLSEFASRVCNSGHQWGLDAADTIAEYAAKLRLANDRKEQ